MESANEPRLTSGFYKVTEVGPADAFYKDRVKVVGTVFEVPDMAHVCSDQFPDPNWFGFNCVTVVRSSGKFDLGEVTSFHQVKVEPIKWTPKPLGEGGQEVLQKFKSAGMMASYHYADDSGREWSLGSACEEQAMKLVDTHPELLDDFKEIGKGFLWSFVDACKRRGID